MALVDRPDSRGYFGSFGGRFVPETLMGSLHDLEESYRSAREDPSFQQEWRAALADYAGRPTALTEAPSFAAEVGKIRVFLKREDLLHTGAHKINNVLGQVLLARRMGRTRIIAETGAGQHGVATATVCARYGLSCVVYMGEEDVRRHSLNYFRMRLLGAEVVTVTSGTRTLKDATNEAIRDWVGHPGDTFYVIGSVVGPHPYPVMVRDFQSILGREARDQILQLAGELPYAAVACVGGGSNAMGLFHAFRADDVKLIGVEAAGEGLDSGRHSASLGMGRPGVLHGAMSMLLQDDDGQISPAHSVSAGLDYPGVGPEHAYLQSAGRAEYVSATDEEALAACVAISRSEGIIPALETAHALAAVQKLGPGFPEGAGVLVCFSGRGDKDVPRLAQLLELESPGV
jgi:tryptophan synthase beta chain